MCQGERAFLVSHKHISVLTGESIKLNYFHLSDLIEKERFLIIVKFTEIINPSIFKHIIPIKLPP